MNHRTLRVVLAPRAAVDARRLLDEGAALARALDADLAAVFVEDADLLRWGSLPFSQEVGVASGTIRPADTEALRRLLARRAGEVRTIVAQVAGGVGVAWSFTVTRGDPIREARRAAVGEQVLLEPPRSAVQHAVGRVAPVPNRTTVAVLASTEQDSPEQQRAWAAARRFAGAHPEAVLTLGSADLVGGPIPRLLVVSLPLITRTPGMLDRVLAVARCPVVLVA